MAWNTDVSADGKPHSVLTPKSWTVKHEAYRSDSDIQLESDFLISCISLFINQSLIFSKMMES